MDFVYFLSSYMPDAGYGGKRVYADVLEQAVAADKLGYRGVAIPEHHPDQHPGWCRRRCKWL